jgi:peptidoglycan/xylan/chitin deacetylase (PgdA/CDA1 family)
MLRRLLVGAATLLACGGLAAAAHGAVPLYVSLTFDDGLVGHSTYALPALQAHGMQGTFYINSGKIGQPGAMSWNDIRTLKAAGMEIGGHTLTHTNLVDVYNNAAGSPTDKANAVKAQVCPDRDAIQAQIGVAPTDFAYPNGAYLLGSDNTTIPNIIKSCGYLSARTTAGIALEPPDGHCDLCSAPLDNAIANPFTMRASQARGSKIAWTGQQGNTDLIPYDVLHDRTNYAIQDLANQTSPRWLIIVLHDVCSAPGQDICTEANRVSNDGHATTIGALNQYLDWLQTQPCVIVKTVADTLKASTATQAPGACPPPVTNPGGGGGGDTPPSGGGGGGGGGSATTTTTAPVDTPPAAPVDTPPAPTPPPVTVGQAPSVSPPPPAAPTVRLLAASSRLLGKGIVDFRAVVHAAAGVKRVEFLVNGKVVGTTTKAPYRFQWSPKAGKAKYRSVKLTVRVVDGLGRVVKSAAPVHVKVRLTAHH